VLVDLLRTVREDHVVEALVSGPRHLRVLAHDVQVLLQGPLPVLLPVVTEVDLLAHRAEDLLAGGHHGSSPFSSGAGAGRRSRSRGGVGVTGHGRAADRLGRGPREGQVRLPAVGTPHSPGPGPWEKDVGIAREAAGERRGRAAPLFTGVLGVAPDPPARRSFPQFYRGPTPPSNHASSCRTVKG